jgi:hypothetical protein
VSLLKEFSLDDNNKRSKRYSKHKNNLMIIGSFEDTIGHVQGIFPRI